MHSILLSIGLTMIYSLKYSTAIDWIVGIIGIANLGGITDLGGASFFMFVKDGVTSSAKAHSTWVCVFNARMAPL
jgi:hypothetical protein